MILGTRLDVSADIAEAMRRAGAQDSFATIESLRVTASFGVGWSAAGAGFAHAYARADAALHAAKRAGRHQVVSAREDA